MTIYKPTERPDVSEAWDKCPFRIVMAGMGDDTVMLIAELYERGLEPDYVVFCDTGSEFPHTYKFIEYLRRWMEEKKWSKLITLRKYDKFDKPLSVISLCQSQNTLPAAAFGSPSCSQRFKTETADKFFNNDPKCWEAWGVDKKGERLSKYTHRILRMVGINADEPQREAKWKLDDKYVQSFPLYDWDIGEHESTAVERVGLYYPGKSSCTICPHLTTNEILMLKNNYPDKFAEAMNIENAYLEQADTSVGPKGLGRRDSWATKLERHYVGIKTVEPESCERCKG